MSVNLPPKTPKLKQWLNAATRQLTAIGIESAKLDAEIILAHTLHKNRTYLHAHSDELLEPHRHEIADARLQLRLERTPIAYIIGHKEFYGRLFKVTPATLIPRPESEVMIDLLKDTLRNSPPSLFDETVRLVDIGTGSGCLGITAKLELPKLTVTLCDISKYALSVARTNAANLHCDVTISISDLLDTYPFSPNIILANLPYVDPSWERSPELAYEPRLALFAQNDGLQLIFKLLHQAALRLVSSGHLFLEADPRQHPTIIKQANRLGFKEQSIQGFIIYLQKSR